MNNPVLQTVPLGTQWPTIDPFLFCAHHLDHYPAGATNLGPAASLDGRQLGNDFGGVDGWNMYHGTSVPGFPQHPHRGFETVSYARMGMIDHADSLGATARFGQGDVQWMTAGAGVQHAEMFPLTNDAEPNPLLLFQVWLNLPAADKLVEPHFTMLWDTKIPRHTVVDTAGKITEVTVIAGTLGESIAPPPPPNSWAARPEADVAIWHLHLDGDASFVLPPAQPGSTRTLYIYEGDGVVVGDELIAAGTGAVVDADTDLVITGVGDGVDIVMLQGRPIGEPVARYGPFVMNTEAEIEQAFTDYRATQFGGWPWPSPEPNHGPDKGRFALHADGRLEDAETIEQ